MKKIIVILLIMSLLMTGCASSKNTNDSISTQTIKYEFARHIQNETSMASSEINRTRGSSEKSLANIKSHLYAIQVLNNTYLTINKEILLNDETLQAAINTVDSFFDDIARGRTISQSHINDLRIILDKLIEEANSL